MEDGERRLFIATIGFDEKFVIRGLMRYGCTSSDKLILIYPRGKVHSESEKNEKAKEMLKTYLSKYIGMKIEDFPMNVPLEGDFTEVFLKESLRLFRKIRGEYKGYDKAIYILSGGMRSLIALCLTSVRICLLKLRSFPIEIYLEAENGIGYICLPSKLLFSELPPENFLEVLSVVVETPGISGKELSERTKMSKASVYRILNELEYEGYLYKEKRGYYPTKLGIYMNEIFKELKV